MPENYDIRKFGPEDDDNPHGFPSKGTGQIVNELGNLIFRSSIRAYSSAAGVQVVEAWVLRKIGFKKVISAREIAVAMSADEGQISRVIKSLLAKKLVARTQDPSYGRRKLIRLTRKGKRAYELVEAITRSREERLVEDVSDVEYRQFLTTIEKSGRTRMNCSTTRSTGPCRISASVESSLSCRITARQERQCGEPQKLYRNAAPQFAPYWRVT